MGNLWAKLGAMAIDYHFLPNARLGIALRLTEPCFGSTMALRRTVLDEIGGLKSLSNVLADDYELGRAVPKRAIALRYRYAHGRASAARKAPWRCFGRNCAGRRRDLLLARSGYAGTLLTYPLPLALLAIFSRLFGVVDDGCGGRVDVASVPRVSKRPSSRPERRKCFGRFRCATCCLLGSSWLRSSEIPSSGKAIVISPVPTAPCARLRDQACFERSSSGPVLRWFRWRRRFALSGEAGDEIVLVSDVACPAGCIGGKSRLIDAPPHDRRLDDILPLAKDYDLVVLHTSMPSFVGRANGRGAEGASTQSQGRVHRRESGSRRRRQPEGCAAIDFVAAQRIRFHHQGRRARQTLGRDRRASATATATE